MNKTEAQNINAGVDTGKDFLDIHIRPFNEYFMRILLNVNAYSGAS